MRSRAECLNRSSCHLGRWRNGCIRCESTCLKGREVSGFCIPIGLNGVFLTEMYSTRA